MTTVNHPVKFGQPVKELPPIAPGRGNAPASHWQTIADACRMYPAMWVPVEIDGLTADRLGSAAVEIRNGKLASFRDGAWEAARRDGKLYVRYLGQVHPLTGTKLQAVSA